MSNGEIRTDREKQKFRISTTQGQTQEDIKQSSVLNSEVKYTCILSDKCFSDHSQLYIGISNINTLKRKS